MIGRKTLAKRGIEKYGLRRDLRMSGQIGAELGLDKGICPKELAESGKGFKGRGSRTEAS